jgi:hypothetical protein
MRLLHVFLSPAKIGKRISHYRSNAYRSQESLVEASPAGAVGNPSSKEADGAVFPNT